MGLGPDEVLLPVGKSVGSGVGGGESSSASEMSLVPKTSFNVLVPIGEMVGAGGTSILVGDGEGGAVTEGHVGLQILESLQ